MAIVAALFQGRTQQRTIRADRRVSALREYSAACNRYAGYQNTMIRMTRFSMALDDPESTAQVKSRSEDVLKEMQKYQEEGTAATAGLLSARDMVNAVFQTKVDPMQGLIVLVPGDEVWKGGAALGTVKSQILKNKEEQLAILLNNCRTTTAQLADRVEE